MSKERLIIESMFKIADKDGRDIPFMLNCAQARLDNEFTGRDIVPKARQEGVSSYVLARFTVRCLHKRNTRAVVISHDKESTQRLFTRVKYFLANIRGPAPVTGLASKTEFTFPKTDSMFYIGTAGARKFGRGDTITDLHCSEVAFWENPKELYSGLSDAVPESGTIILESTGNGKNWYYRRVRDTLAGKGRYTMHFLDWVSFPEYTCQLTSGEEEEVIRTLDPDYEEDYLYHEVKLTPGQIQFRRYKLAEKDWDIDLFKQEYPLTLDECFRATGRSIFHKVRYSQAAGWNKVGVGFHILADHPQRNGIYGIGADVSGGVGKDRSVAEIIDLNNLEQVGEWVSDRVPPDRFGLKLAELGKMFNDAYITVEANNHGIVTLDSLRKDYPPYLIHRKTVSPGSIASNHILNYGLLQTSRVRPLAIGTLRKLLATVLLIHSPDLKDELDTFIETESGKLEAEESSFDDRVMAMAAFAYTVDKAMLIKAPNVIEIAHGVDPFSLDGIMEELRGRQHGGFPIACQAGVEYENSVHLQ